MLSIIVPDMVKHSVPLCFANVAAISSFRCFPRPAICRGRAAAGLSFAVRLAGPRANVQAWSRFRPALRIYQGLEQWNRPHRGNPESLRSKPPPVCLPRAGPAISACATVTIRTARPSTTSLPLHRFCCARLVVAGITPPLLAATPYLFFGVMLGASLWYVTRRLYGNSGGYIALALYCFSPAMIVNVAGAQSGGEMGAVWGAFGTVFTAIAVVHTLYAPREVVLWNWRRILLWGCLWHWQRATSFRWGCWRW